MEPVIQRVEEPLPPSVAGAMNRFRSAPSEQAWGELDLAIQAVPPEQAADLEGEASLHLVVQRHGLAIVITAFSGQESQCWISLPATDTRASTWLGFPRGYRRVTSIVGVGDRAFVTGYHRFEGFLSFLAAFQHRDGTWWPTPEALARIPEVRNTADNLGAALSSLFEDPASFLRELLFYGTNRESGIESELVPLSLEGEASSDRALILTIGDSRQDRFVWADTTFVPLLETNPIQKSP